MSDTSAPSSSSPSPSPRPRRRDFHSENPPALRVQSPGSPPTWDTLVATHASACAAMAAISAAPTAAGFRLYWCKPNGFGWMDLPLGGAYAILGRHSECDAVLDGDLTLPLRHLLATTVDLADGVALRLLDLQTATPFFLGDSMPRRSLVVTGAVALSVGQHVIGAVPIEEIESADGEEKRFALRLEPLGRPRVTDAEQSSTHASGTHASPERTPPPLSARFLQPAPAPAPVPLRGPRETMVTSMPPSRPISEVASIRLTDDVMRSAARIVLQRSGSAIPGKVAVVDLTEEQLDRGIIIGRVEHGKHPELEAVLTVQTSRGHVLLLRTLADNARLEVFDLCSLNGTYRGGGKRVRRVQIVEDDTVLILGGSGATVTMRVRLPPA